MKPSRKFVDLNFWLSHVSGVAMYYLSAESNRDSTNEVEPIILLSVMFIFFFTFIAYFFSIGRYAEKFGKRRTAWSGVSFLLMPLGFWGSYICSFFFRQKQ